MALPFTTYAAITAGEGLLGRVKSLVAGRKTEAETYALRKVQAWLLAHLDEPEEGIRLGNPRMGPRTAQDRLDDLEEFWDDNAVDSDIQDLARVIAEVRYLQTQGHYDGKTGSDGFHRRREHRAEIWEIQQRIYRRGKLALAADIDDDHLLVVRFPGSRGL